MAGAPSGRGPSPWVSVVESLRSDLRAQRDGAAAAVAELQPTVAENKARLQSTQDDLEKCRATVAQLEQSLPGLRATGLDSIIEPAEEALELQRGNLGRCERDVRSFLQEYDDAVSELERLRREVSRVDENLATLVGREADLDAAASWLKEASGGAHLATASTVEVACVGWKACREQQAAADRQVASLEHQVEQCEEDKQVLQVRLDRHEQQMQRTEETIEALRRRVAELEAREAQVMKAAAAAAKAAASPQQSSPRQPRAASPSASQAGARPRAASGGRDVPRELESAAEFGAMLGRMANGQVPDLPADCKQQ